MMIKTEKLLQCSVYIIQKKQIREKSATFFTSINGNVITIHTSACNMIIQVLIK